MNKRRLLFRIGAVAILIAIAACMMVIGRGHTVYVDNKTLEYNGETYKTPYRVNVYIGEERIAKLSARERGMTTNIGQNFKMTLGVIKEKGNVFNSAHNLDDNICCSGCRIHICVCKEETSAQICSDHGIRRMCLLRTCQDPELYRNGSIF